MSDQGTIASKACVPFQLFLASYKSPSLSRIIYHGHLS